MEQVKGQAAAFVYVSLLCTYLSGSLVVMVGAKVLGFRLQGLGI